MTQDTALDMKDVELNEIDPEKQPMAAEIGEPPVDGLNEKNGVVKVKLEDEDDDSGRVMKFTGLSKEELLKVAGTPGWVRVRWALLVLFWLGWAGMLAGAVAIIVQAPRCRPLPVTEWWNKGPLYQVGDPESFKDSDSDGVSSIAGVQKRLDYISALKVKGLVVGPLHITSADDLSQTDLKAIDHKFGTKEDFQNLIEAARKKSIHIILDLTPNYRGNNAWFNKNETTLDSILLEQIKEAMYFWLELGLGGIHLNGIDAMHNPGEILAELRNITANYSSEGKARVLLASANDPRNENVLTVNDTAAGILTARYLISNDKASDDSLGNRIKQYQQPSGEQDRLLWAVSPRLGHMASLVHERLLQVYQLLLFTLQGTPFILYGDEIGLKDDLGQAPFRAPYMPWDDSKTQGISSERKYNINENITIKAQEEDKNSPLNFCKRMSELRGKERSFLHGDFRLLLQSDKSLAYERSWDQNERFVSLLNFDPVGEVEVTVTAENLPEQCTVVLSSNLDRKEGSSVSLKNLKLAPGEALLLKYPYSG